MISNCAICSSKKLELLWDLPKLPFTEKYGKYNSASPTKDQSLLICSECGHVQLAHQVSPQELYQAHEYAFRTSESKSACVGADVFLQFAEKIKGTRSFHSLLDLGGNDLYIAERASTFVQHRAVVDPILADTCGTTEKGILKIGKMIEDIDLRSTIEQPDLIFCRHVLEHISSPKKVLEKLFNEAHEEALYIFEIPCFENLRKALRFDAIFHQHYHYYDLQIFLRLLQEIGGEYLGHCYNFQGPCGGSLLIAFQKARHKIQPLSYSIEKRHLSIRNAIHSYTQQMGLLKTQLNNLETPIYGYGASLMLATLAYHLQTDFSHLECILDDDAQKEGMEYQNIPVTVRYTPQMKVTENSNFLITSLENTRPIFQKIISLKPKRILTPLIN